MLESLIDFLTTTIPTIFVGWSIPIVYICLCLISGYARRRREAKIPDRIEPRPCVPSLHPVMLSALQFHGETASQNYSNTLCAALAGIVHLIGRGKVACTETVPPPEDEAPSPFVERRRRRARMTARDEVAHAFGADVLLARRDADDGDPRSRPRARASCRTDSPPSLGARRSLAWARSPSSMRRPWRMSPTFWPRFSPWAIPDSPPTLPGASSCPCPRRRRLRAAPETRRAPRRRRSSARDAHEAFMGTSR